MRNHETRSGALYDVRNSGGDVRNSGDDVRNSGDDIRNSGNVTHYFVS